MKKEILIIDSSFDEESLYSFEYVNPIKNIIRNINNSSGEMFNFQIIHYLNLIKDIDYYERFTHIIITGTGLKDNIYLNYIDKFKFLKKFNIPIIGICAGAQILAILYDGELEQKKEIGIFKPKIIEKDKIIENVYLNEIYLVHNNSIKIDNSLFKIILKTENNIPQLMKIKNKNVFLCQFHPEVKNKKLIENFINI